MTEPNLTIDGVKLEVVEFGEGESKHTAAVYTPTLKALLSADLVYNQAHLYLQEKHLESWLQRLDELEIYAKNRVTTIHPGHGNAAGLELYWADPRLSARLRRRCSERKSKEC